MMAILTVMGLGIPVAVSVRGEPSQEYYSPVLRFLARSLFHLADGVILQTRRCMEFFPKSIQKKAVILKNPVNPSFFKPRYEGEREKTITAVGRIDENKNHELLIRAFAQIAGQFPEYRLVIYGEGDKRQELCKLSEELGLKTGSVFREALQMFQKLFTKQVFCIILQYRRNAKHLNRSHDHGTACDRNGLSLRWSGGTDQVR